MSLCILALGVAVCAQACHAEPLDDLTLGALLRDAATVVHERAPSRARLAMGWAQVRLENGAASRCHNLGSIGAVGAQPFFTVGPARVRAFPDYVEAAQAYWRAVSPAALAYFDAGDPMGAAVALSRTYHRADPVAYGRAMGDLAGTARRRVLPWL